jgi:hypothetical protein
MGLPSVGLVQLGLFTELTYGRSPYLAVTGNFTITGMQPKGRASEHCHFLFFFLLLLS